MGYSTILHINSRFVVSKFIYLIRFCCKCLEMIKKILSLLLFFSLCSSVFAKIPEKEKRALIELYTSTDGGKWKKPWNLSKPVATWQGVKIKNNTVISLILIDNNLVGTIPGSIGSLKNLRVLNLAFNSIGGVIPESIVSLKDLKVLRLGKNQISGEIPEHIGRMKKLEIIDLFSNKISGELPKALGKMRRLKVISLSDNRLIGTIPEELGELNDLERLELANNKIEGDVPEVIGELANLNMLILAENKLSGEFPTTIFSLPKLQVLQLQKNSFDKEHLRNSIPVKTGLALLDFDDRINNIDFINSFSKNDVRTADTKFEDVD